MGSNKVEPEAAQASKTSQSFLHDLQNLMCVILHQSEVGRDAFHREPVELRQILGRIHEAARMTVELINKERSTYPASERFDVRILLERVAEVARAHAGSATQVRCVVPLKPLWMEGQPETLLRLCLNLALNAVDAAPGGDVTLSVSGHKDAPDAPVLIAGQLPAAPWVLLEVADDGRGIPRELRDHIWEPGVTTKETSGSGQGLALVRSLVEAAGAGISLNPGDTGRTTFRVYWPAVARQPSCP